MSEMNMVERVARAYRAKIVEFDPTIPNDINDPVEPQELEIARAAIEAMREPTENMGYAGQVYDRMSSPDEIAKASWRAMIDRALKDEP